MPRAKHQRVMPGSALVLPGAEVLAGEGKGSLRYRIAAGKTKPSILTAAAALPAMAVLPKELMEDWMRTLEMEKMAPLQTGGNADFEDADEFIPVDAQLL